MNDAMEIVVRVLVAAAFGGLVGLERELTGRPAGIRTHILVTAGACIFTAISIFGFPGLKETDRVAAGVVTGIGFIGGGAILKSEGGYVTGLTTAASLWSCAAIGMLAGAGFFLVGLIITVLDLFVLEFINWVVEFLAPRAKRSKLLLSISGDFHPGTLESVKKILSERGCYPELLRYGRTEVGRKFEMCFITRISARTSLENLAEEIYRIEGIEKMVWS